MAGAYVDALKRHSRQLAALEDGTAEAFMPLLTELRDRLRGRLMDVAGADDTLDAFRLRTALGEAEAGIALLETKAKANYGLAEQKVVELAIEHIGTELTHLSRAFDAQPIEVSLDAAKVFADPGQRLLAHHFESSVDRYGLDILNGIRRELFFGMRSGDGFGAVVSRISGMQGPLGKIGRSSAERMFRTETSQAYGAAQHAGIAQAERQVPGLKKVWLHVSSYRCETCMPLHGTERPLDGSWTIKVGKRTRKVMHAPSHPNCTCRVSAMRPGWRRSLEKLGYLQADKPGL